VLEALSKFAFGMAVHILATFIAMSLVALWLVICKKALPLAKILMVLYFGLGICVISYYVFFRIFF